MRQQRERRRLRIAPFPSVEQAVIGDDLSLRSGMEGRKVLRDQIVKRAEGIRALIGVGGAVGFLSGLFGVGGILIDRGGRNRRDCDLP